MQVALQLCISDSLVVVAAIELRYVKVCHVLSLDVHLMQLSIIDPGAIERLVVSCKVLMKRLLLLLILVGWSACC